MPNSRFTVGLAFPLIREQKRQHDLYWFASCLEKSGIIPDLIVFPEAFEAIAPERPFLGREMFRLHPAVQDIIDKYRHFCSRFNTNAIVGVAASYGGVEKLNGAGNDQYGLIIPRQGEPVVYHKHSTSVQNTFFDEDWNLGDSFPVVELSGVRVGLSICHDSYLSFIPRVLKKKGTTIWVNPSFRNVRPHIWQAVLRTRATENDFVSICALFRDEDKGHRQLEPYAFFPGGKATLRELHTKKSLYSLPERERTGKIFVCDTSTPSLECIGQTKGSGSRHQKKTVIDSRGIIINAKRAYRIRETDLRTFLFFPETLWKLCFEHIEQTTIFFVGAEDQSEWDALKQTTVAVTQGRCIEFSTLFLFIGHDRLRMAAYRSSNYKDSRIVMDAEFPFEFDDRFLFGIQNTCKISWVDPRGKKELYFTRLRAILDFLTDKDDGSDKGLRLPLAL